MMKKLMLTHALIMVFSVGWTVVTETIALNRKTTFFISVPATL